MKFTIMERGKCLGRVVTSIGPPLLLLLWVSSLCSAQEDFNCHSGGGLIFNGDISERAAIIPRGDINVEVGQGPVEVLCRFNSSNLDVRDVFFTTQEGPIAHETVNSSTIRIFIEHSEPAKYTLYCKLRRKNTAKELCSQTVKAGYPATDVENFSCMAPDNEVVNCSWTTPYNPVKTIYTNLTYLTPKFVVPSRCPRTNEPFYTWCYWDKSHRFLLRDKFDFHITRKNDLGVKTYSHHVFIPEIVYPNKVAAEVALVSPIRVRVSWNLTYPLDVFHHGLFHRVEYKLAAGDTWENVTNFFHRHTLEALTPKRSFAVEMNLPYAYTEYEFRVRIHTGYGEVKEELWSPYNILSVMTEALPPTMPPKTSQSTFEIVEGLDNRDIYVDFQDIDKIYSSGKDFHYKMLVYPVGAKEPLDIEPSERTKSYFKYKFMNFTEYRFEIIPMNEKGEGSLHSEVIVPNSDCMPKKTEMFTVITKTTPKGKIFGLYWVPSQKPNVRCPGADFDIDSYDIFWCKRTFGDRCKEKLFWQEISNPDLVIKDLSNITISPITIYEKNITDLPDNEIYTFGVAANTGNYSSGIRWSSCIVDDTEPPLAPQAYVAICTNKTSSVEVKWNLKCLSLSAVPLGFNVSYCKSEIPDFGHCTSAVQNVKVNSPAASSVIIANLEPGVSYIFSVSVLSLIGEGRQSAPKMIILRDEIPSGPPTNLTIDNLSNSFVVLSWNPPAPEDQKGLITEYRITTHPHTKTTVVDALILKKGETIKETLQGLMPFTSYEVKVSACTKAGCGYKTQASSLFKTKAGEPDNIDDFILDVSNWRLMWDLKRCNSVNCSFELRVPFNETTVKTVSVGDKETTLSLRDVGLECNHTEMNFFIRAKGEDEDGHILYGNWSSVKKAANECPKESLAWWAIAVITSVCVVITFAVLVIMRCGLSTVRKAIEDCKQSINLPKGIQAAESAKDHRKEFPSDRALITRTSEPSFLLLQPQNSPANLADSLRREDRMLTKPNRDSVSSEEVNLIDDTTESDRHGRNLSGGSDHSSGQDSALLSGSPSVIESDPDALSAEMGLCLHQETTLRQRSPGPVYVQHGVIPEKLSEGYVTAHSVPSLPHLYKDGLISMQQSTPDLNANHSLVGWTNARRASTGYISMPESENESPMRRDPLSDGSLSRAPPSRVKSGFPSYSRYSFNPSLKIDPSINHGLPTAGPQVGYTTIADVRVFTPTLPSSENRNAGYVSAGDPFGALKRQPSLPLIPKNCTIGEENLPLGAYCRVGSRGNSANQGYVSAGAMDSMPVNLATTSIKNPYVSYGEAAMLTSNQAVIDSTAANPPYVELGDGGCWAHPVHRSTPIVPQQRPSARTSAPMDGARIGRVGQLPRPNTTEATMGHRKRDGNPSLSKQSSGYVSQETIPHCEAVVMSPKRLMTQAATPHTVIMSPTHQASMV